jgi:hypothetical protein
MDRLEQIFEATYENATVNSFDLKLMAYKVKKFSAMMNAYNAPVAPASEGKHWLRSGQARNSMNFKVLTTASNAKRC